jgi:oligopeptide/dipeptide ABC transporter ATP-binding protein
VSDILLQIQNLKTFFFDKSTELRAVDDLSLTVRKGECAAIIGESGSGKTVTALSVLRLIPFPPGLIMGGSILFQGEDILGMDQERLRKLRGSSISMIFQEASVALNPVMTIGKQISEPLRFHKGMKKKEAYERATELLDMVGISNAKERMGQFPHEFSGGMQQRAMIAMAMSCEPKLLIADEPTTALDVTIQAQVLEKLNILRKDRRTTLIIITHNLGIVARYADSVKIMYGGKIVEEGTPQDIFENPHHPYTLGLVRAVPRLDLPRSHGLYAIPGEPPVMSRVQPDSCAFSGRCAYAEDVCAKRRPPLEAIEPGHLCACFCKEKTEGERLELNSLNRKRKDNPQ